MTPSELHELDLACARLLGLQIDFDATERWTEVIVLRGASPTNFQPTRSRADAMEVLEWLMRGRKNMHQIQVGENDAGFWCGCWESGLLVQASASTLPLAICLFAAKAREGGKQ